ncbi:MAG TPA: TonB-dependent receptor [Burkholderiales bacterium]|nr:TonB-dependent receptor [Burkholderiales bacterium]
MDAHAAASRDIAELSLEELSDVKITSVSGHAERLSDAAAAVYVITNEDIRRSGVRSLPEALRLAPNLLVARVNASQYAISARGFNGTIANKLLVLIDGRAVYTPLFSGVFWDAQDVMLEDVERIEVISGPGTTLWGANAVNGVINVITRSAADTQGALAGVEAGSAGRNIGARYGGKVGDGSGAFRVYAKGFDEFNTRREAAPGATASDAWSRAQAGFRMDWSGHRDGLTLQADAYRGTEDQAALGDVRISGANLLGRWTRDLGNAGQIRLQSYVDRTQRNIPGSIAEGLTTYDLALQHNLPAMGSHAWTWGAGYRLSSDHVTNAPAIAFLPADMTMRWWNVFAQDEFALAPDLRLTAGAKFEANPFSGKDFLPSLRLGWALGPNSLLWGALSRAVRAPARLDRDLFAPGNPPYLLAGGPDFRSEISNVAEVGYRAQPSPRLSYSVSVYRNYHERLRSLEPTGSGNFVIGNKMTGTTTGLEAWGGYQVAGNWRLGAGLLLLRQNLRLEPGSGDPTGPPGAGNDPSSQWSLRSSYDVPAGKLFGRGEFDITLRRVGALPNPSVPAYTALDARYGWTVRPGVEVSLVGQNLLDAAHPEFGAPATRSEIGRALFVRLELSR